MVRVFPSGEVSFRFRYTYAGQRRVMLLGQFGDGGLTLQDAFTLHHEASSALAGGVDPIENRARKIALLEAERRARAEADTVDRVVNQFVHRELRAERWDAKTRCWIRDPKSPIRPRKRPEDAEALLKANLQDMRIGTERVGSMKAHELTRRQMIQLLQKINDRGAPITSNRVHSLLVQLFNWATSMDLVPASVMAGVPKVGGIESPRERVLAQAEIRIVWNVLESAPISRKLQLALKLLLLTAQRRGALAHAQWAHFDISNALWTIPPELRKSSRRRAPPAQPHLVPLSPSALTVLLELHGITGKGRWVLPGQRRKLRPDTPIDAAAISHAVRNCQKYFGIPKWTPHDLRRTAITGMIALGIERTHVKKAVDHRIGDMTETYDLYQYFKEKQYALNAWAEHVLTIVDSSSEST